MNNLIWETCISCPKKETSPSEPEKTFGDSPSPDSRTFSPINSKLIVKKWWRNSGETIISTTKRRPGPLPKLQLPESPSKETSCSSSWNRSWNWPDQSSKETSNKWRKWWPPLMCNWNPKKKTLSENNSWRLLCPDGSTVPISSWKWWCSTYRLPRPPKNTEPAISTKDPSMMSVDNPSKTATPKDLLWCTSPRWCPPPINPDSSPSEESSPEQSPPDRKSESWDPTTDLERKTIFTKNLSKELSLWWAEPSSIFPMFLAETPSD